MLLANLHNFLTELRGQSMQFVQTADVPNPASTWTPLGSFDVLSSYTCMTGQWLTKLPRSPHQIGRVSNPCSFSVEFAVATIIKNHKTPQNERPGNLSVPKHGAVPILHKPNQIRILFHKIVNDLQCFGYKSVC